MDDSRARLALEDDELHGGRAREPEAQCGAVLGAVTVGADRQHAARGHRRRRAARTGVDHPEREWVSLLCRRAGGSEQHGERGGDGHAPHLVRDRTSRPGLRHPPAGIGSSSLVRRWASDGRCWWRTAARSPSASSRRAGGWESGRRRRSGPGDHGALHTRVADTAVDVPSYLDAGALVAAAREAGAELVHPGYGFLAESAAFAEAVVAAGLTWIGPSPDALRRGGDKLEAKRIAAAAGVPTLTVGEPGEVGLPLLVKAAAGGGGRGMRVVERAEDLEEALAAASREAEAAFGDGTVFCERYLTRPRHVEVQLIGDRHGTVLALGERDCSVQRRHQKVVEESPPPGLSETVRARLAAHAVAFGRELGYESAGTAEFLVEDDEPFFLELNARIQVEHPVTEAVTGLDLVELQLRVADGESLAGLEPSFDGARGGGAALRGGPAQLPAAAGHGSAPAPSGRGPRGRGRGGGRRGRRKLRPDDRQADRPRGRSRRRARPARRCPRRGGRRGRDDEPAVPPLARRAPGVPRRRPVDRLPGALPAPLPSPAARTGRPVGGGLAAEPGARRRRSRRSRSSRRRTRERITAATGASPLPCPAR